MSDGCRNGRTRRTGLRLCRTPARIATGQRYLRRRLARRGRSLCRRWRILERWQRDRRRHRRRRFAALDGVEPSGFVIDRPQREPRRQRGDVDGAMEFVGSTSGKQLNFRTPGRRACCRQVEGCANIGLVGGNIVASGYDGPHTAGIQRGCAHPNPAVPDAERNLRRRHRQRAGRQRRLDDLLQPGVILHLPAIAGAHRRIEGPRIEARNSCGLQRHSTGYRTARPSAPRRCGHGLPVSSALRPARRASRALDNAMPCRRRR